MACGFVLVDQIVDIFIHFAPSILVFTRYGGVSVFEVRNFARFALHVGRELLHRVEEVLLAVGAKLEAAATPERARDLRGELVAYDAAVRRVVPRHGEVQKYALQAARGKQAQ